MRGREWQGFDRKVILDEGGIRQMLHVRCARNPRGWVDIEVLLTA